MNQNYPKSWNHDISHSKPYATWINKKMDFESCVNVSFHLQNMHILILKNI